MLILVAHGTRSAAGLETIGEIADRVSARVGPLRTAFVDVLGPDPAEVLGGATETAIIVPAFLASGYHVHTDLPARIAESGHVDTRVTRPLGPDPVLAAVMHERLVEAGWRAGDAVLMAAAGSSDPRARRDVYRAAEMLGQHVGEVDVGFLATGAPRVRDVVRLLRSHGRRRVFVAPYLLAPGLFHDRLAGCGAAAVAAPLGAHPGVVDAIAGRFACLGAHATR
ncbi:MAG: sirohydrochlorin chelatase [Mycobacteriaceae bacterium]|nr:sirohydrochlorin chelatase [Mycobacteriaceae bacterium]